MGLIWAVQEYEVYVTSGQFPVEVFIDHNPLTFFSKIKNKNQRLTRWSLFLQDYNLDVKYINGKQNLVDAWCVVSLLTNIHGAVYHIVSNFLYDHTNVNCCVLMWIMASY